LVYADWYELRRLFVERCEVRRFLTTRSVSLDKKERRDRDRPVYIYIVGEVLFVKIVFLEKRIDRTIDQERYQRERIMMLVKVGRSADISILYEEICVNGIKIRERV